MSQTEDNQIESHVNRIVAFHETPKKALAAHLAYNSSFAARGMTNDHKAYRRKIEDRLREMVGGRS